jgi:hypothetical protein
MLSGRLSGQVASRTKLHYRGKGLPSMRQLQDDGQIQQLTIMANDVYLEVPSGNSERLETEMTGTFLFWELHGDAREKWLD